MSQSDSTRPVSGEIMMPDMVPDRASGSCRFDKPSGDVIDVDFETVAPHFDRSTGAQPEPAVHRAVSGLDMLKPRESKPQRKLAPATPLFWIFGAVLVAGAFWVSGGHNLLTARIEAVHQAPSQPLQLVDVASRVERQGAHAMLIVDGAALNNGEAVVAVPSISINVLAENGSTTRYFLGTNDQHLGPGARFPFSSRLVAPREGVKFVSVTFRAP